MLTAPPVRMIAIDLDGTLIGAEGKVSPGNLAAVRAATDAGIEVVIATGRRHSYAMRVLRALELSDENILISSNGTVTRSMDAILIDRTLLPTKTTLWLCQHLEGFRNAMVITYDLVQPTGDDAYGALIVEELADLHSSIGKWMEANAPYIEQSLPIEAVVSRRAAAGESPIQMMLCGTIERMRRAQARLLEDSRVYSSGITPRERLASAEIAISRTEYLERDLSLLDILPAACSKGIALLRLAASHGIDPSEIMAIGDNWNDVSMLEIAGRPVLMENAPEDLKDFAIAKGWIIGGHHLCDGVAGAINAVLALQPLSEIEAEEEPSSVIA